MRQNYPEPTEMVILGYSVLVDWKMGHLAVTHNGSITWDDLQAIKNEVWGRTARAIEVYPVQAVVVNNAQMRHLWLLGADDFCPDLLGYMKIKDTLEARCAQAWAD